MGKFFLAEFNYSNSCLPPALTILPNRVRPRSGPFPLRLSCPPLLGIPPVSNAKAIFHPCLFVWKLNQGNEKRCHVHKGLNSIDSKNRRKTIQAQTEKVTTLKPISFNSNDTSFSHKMWVEDTLGTCVTYQ